MTIELNYFYRVDITVAQYDAGTTSTKTYSFTNKVLKDSTSLTTYWPILQSVGEVGLIAGETLPTISLSSIQIDNSIGSFGANRKFSDVLERYTPIEQSVIIYVGQVSNDSDTVTSWTATGQGVISDYEHAAQGESPSLTFNIRPLRYSETVLTLEVSRSVSGMSNAPDSSLGRAVPLLIGDTLDVLPVRISADGAENPRYAIGTCLYQHVENDTSTAKIYCKNELDFWEVANNNFTTTIGNTKTGDYALNRYAGQAWGLTAGSGLLCGIKFRAVGKGLASSTARLTVFVLRYNSTTLQVIEEVATGTASLSTYNTQNAASTDPFDLSIAFDTPVYLSAEESYAVGWSVTGYQVNDLAISYSNSTTTAGFFKDSTTVNESAGHAWKYSIAAPYNSGTIRYDLLYYESTFTKTEANAFTQTGLGYSSLQLTGQAVDSGQAIAPLDNFPILIGNMKGLTPYGGGALLERPQSIVTYLNYQFNGVSWSDASYWDDTTLSSSHYEYLYNGATPTVRSRVVKAIFESRVTFSEVLSEICKGTASKVGILPNGKSFMYPFGMTEAVAVDIPPSDITALNWVVGDISTVINRAVIKTGFSYLKAPKTFEGQGDAGFQYTTDYSAVNETKVAEITAKSRALYGNKELEDTEFLVYPNPSGGAAAYLCSTTTGKAGSILAEYYLTRFGLPITKCSFVVPFNRYSDLTMFDVITFSSPSFPAYYGTDPNARDGVVDVGGSVSSVSGADYGYETVRAQTYRGLIEGVTTILAMEHAPAIKLDVLVLLNYPNDPT
ncbi:MAG: hypothetical protein E6R03_09720 [Hyphomicrobiaceae bacterium]|nr:MAG: hypothetical protein E6R03_09720 [Hyphomicrobiaceae bacterium]